MQQVITSTRQKVTPYLSRKISVLSFIAMTFVVFIHSYNYSDSYLLTLTRISEGKNICAMIEFFVANIFSRFSTPLFFLISGFLFFINVDEFDISLYKSKIGKRITSLLIPYIFWCTFWILTGLLLANICGLSEFPLIKAKFGSKTIDILKQLYFDPLSFQFWYLKDLFIIALFSPIFYLVAKKFKQYSILLFIFPWLLDIYMPNVPNFDGLVFFLLGTHLALNERDNNALNHGISNKSWIIVPVLWICLCVLHTFMSLPKRSVYMDNLILTLLHKACIITGLMSVSIIYDLIHAARNDETESKLFKTVMSSSFLIFCIHEPLQHFIFQKIFSTPKSDAVHLIVYFALPFCFIALGIGLNALLQKHNPKLRSFLCGGQR